MSSDEWGKFTLGEISDMKYGRMPKKEDIVDFGYPIFSGYRVTGYHKEYMFDEPQLIVVARGVGGTGDVKISPPKCFLTNLSIAVVLNEKIADKKYLYYNFQKRNLKFLDTGSAQSQITISDLKRHVVSLPALPEQKAIAATLSALDDKNELNNRINKTLEEMAQALFKRWFVDFEFPDENGQPYKSSGGEMEESELGLIPKGWKTGALGEIASLLNGYAFRSQDWTEQGVPVVKIGSVKPGYVDLKQVSYVSETIAMKCQRYRLEAGDILVGMTGYVGEVGLVPISSCNPLLNQRVGKIVGISGGFSERAFLFCLLRQPSFKSFVEARAHGTAQANASSKDILNYQIIIPRLEIRDTFNLSGDSLIRKILCNRSESLAIESLRDSLLPKLMTGEIRVPIEEVAAHV